MTFADAIKPTSRTGIPCSVAAFLHELADKDPAEAKHFADFLYEKNARGWRYSYAEVFDKIGQERKANGYQTLVRKSQINRHRGAGCRCDEDAA